MRKLFPVFLTAISFLLIFIISCGDDDKAENPAGIVKTGNVVCDSSTRLCWQDPQREAYNYNDIGLRAFEADQYCDELILGGFNDWRVPTRREFSTLLNHSRLSPSLDVTFFPYFSYDSPNEVYYWTSTPYYNDPNEFWKMQLSFPYEREDH